MANRRGWVVAVVLVLLFGYSGVAHSQAQTGGYLSAVVATALQPDDIIGSLGAGFQGGYRFPWGLLLVGDVLYTGTDYYYFDFDDGREWRQAGSWREVPSGSVRRGDWPFYRTRFLLGGAAGLSGSIARVGLFSTVGFMLSILDFPDISEDYPEFADAAIVSSIGNDDVQVSTSVRAGVVYPVGGSISGQLSYMVLLTTEEDDFGEREWLQRNGLIYLGVTVNFGGRR